MIKPSQKTSQNSRTLKAALTTLTAAIPHLNEAVSIATEHGHPYTGPDIEPAIEVLRAMQRKQEEQQP